MTRNDQTPSRPFTLITCGCPIRLGCRFRARPSGSRTFIAAQKAAWRRLHSWTGSRGPAWTILASGDKHCNQTDREDRAVPGRIRKGYRRARLRPAARLPFKRCLVLFPTIRRASLQFIRMPRLDVGDFAFKPTSDGYVWEIPAGADDDSIYVCREGRRVARGRRPDHARKRPGPLLRDESQTNGRYNLARGRRDQPEVNCSFPEPRRLRLGRSQRNELNGAYYSKRTKTQTI